MCCEFEIEKEKKPQKERKNRKGIVADPVPSESEAGISIAAELSRRQLSNYTT